MKRWRRRQRGSGFSRSGDPSLPWVGAGIIPAPIDNKAEREQTPDDLDWPAPDRVVEDEDSAADRDDVGGHRGERDHLEPGTELKAASGGVERDHHREQRSREPRIDQRDNAAIHRVRQVFDRDVGDAEQGARRDREHHPLVAVRVVELDRAENEQTADHEQPALDTDQRGQ